MGGGGKARKRLVREVDGVKLMARAVRVEMKDLKALADEGKKRLGSGIVAIVGVAEDGKAGIVVGVTEDLDGEGRARSSWSAPAPKHSAARAAAAGRDMAQAGGPDGDQAKRRSTQSKPRSRRSRRSPDHGGTRHPARHRLYEILERSVADDPLVHAVHMSLILLIIVNVAAVVMESVPSIRHQFRDVFIVIEIVSGVMFTLEYALRLWCAPEYPPWREIAAWRARLRWTVLPQSLIDLMAIVPFYVIYWDAGGSGRFCLLRLFALQLARYSPGLTSLMDAIYTERRALIAWASSYSWAPS